MLFYLVLGYSDSKLKKIQKELQNKMLALIFFVVSRDHVKELKSAMPTEPVIFMKPPSSYIFNGQTALVYYHSCLSKNPIFLILSTVCRFHVAALKSSTRWSSDSSLAIA